MEPEEESVAERDARHARVDELIERFGEVLNGVVTRDALDALCMTLASVCADCGRPDATLVDVVAFLTGLFQNIRDEEPETTEAQS